MKPGSVKRNIAILLLGLLPAGLGASPPQLMVVGASLETSSGCPVYLRGVDVSGFEYSVQGYGGGSGTGAFPASEVLTSVEVAQEQWHCNFVRIPLNQDLWLGTGTGSPCTTSGNAQGDSGPAYQAMVTDVVQWADAHGMYVLLDLHWSGIGTSACASSQHDMPDDGSIAFWQSVAAAFPASKYPGVMFDLYNEPGGAHYNQTLNCGGATNLTQNDAGWTLWRNGGTETAQADCTAYYTPGMQNLLTTIRDTGASNVVFAGGINWAFDLTGLAGPAGNDGTTSTYWLNDVTWGAGVVYAAHIYPWKLNGCGCSGSNIGPCVQFTTQGVLGVKPVVITEFGPDQPQGYSCGTTYSPTATVDAEDFVPPMVQWLLSNKVPFSAWNLGSSGPSLIYTSSGSGYTGWSYDSANPGQSTYPPTSYFGSYVLAALTTTTGSTCTTPTDTPTPTPVQSATDSPTRTATLTPSVSPTPSDSATITPTPTITPTFSESPTFTASPSSTATFTVTPTFTATPTFSPTPTITDTPTVTPTYTASPSASPTWTPVPGSAGPPEVYPNPFHLENGAGVLRFGNIAPGSQIQIFDMIGRLVRTLVAVGNPHVDTWNGLNDNGRQVVTGIYLVYITQPSGLHNLQRLAVLP